MAGAKKRPSGKKKAAAKRSSPSGAKRASEGGTARSQQEPLAISPPADRGAAPAEMLPLREETTGRRKKSGKSASTVAELATDAQFVFRGIVQQRGVATFDEVPLTADTLVVGIEEIIKAPEMLQDFAQSAITVQLGEGQSAEVGERYTFYTNGWIFGAGLAVQSVVVAADTEEEHGVARATLQRAPARAVQARANEADMVVAGQVTQLRQAPKATNAPITEHDPHWQDAVVTVDTVLGAHATSARQPKEVVVRFAASRDVRWATAPKFGVGQAGIWMLGHKDKAQRNAMRAVADVSDEEYVVIDPNDFHPIDAIDQVKSLLAQDNTGDAP